MEPWIAWSEIYAHPLPENHRFPMEKYQLLPEQLCFEGTVADSAFFAPKALGEPLLLAVHSEAYLHKIREGKLSPQEERRTGFPWSLELFHREVTIMGGTVEAAERALRLGVGMNIAGGTHHAFKDRGEGFCLLNDLVLAAHWLLKGGHARRILIVDLDVHQGNGTAALCAELPEVFTFSMHGEKNYPFHKERSDLDIGLPKGMTDTAYLALLDGHLNRVLDSFEPDFMLYQSGVDVLATDKLGHLGLSLEGCKQRDKLVLGAAHRHGIPLVASMGGGYSPHLRDIVEAHANTFRLACWYWF